jgi:hypothetical protein
MLTGLNCAGRLPPSCDLDGVRERPDLMDELGQPAIQRGIVVGAGLQTSHPASSS